MSACPECGAPVERVFHPVAVHFKGSGFYTTDYARKARRRRRATDGGSESKESKDSKDSKADKKPAASSSKKDD